MDFDKQKVKQWIEEYWTAPRECPICEADDWILMDKVWELREFHRVPFALGGPDRPIVLPVIALMCNVCGYTIFFNAIAVRAVSRPASEGGER